MHKYPKAIYANPLEPAVCPILAVAIILFTETADSRGRQSLFVGERSSERYGSILREVLEGLTEEEEAVLERSKYEIAAFHAVPSGWVWPTGISVQRIWDLWWEGTTSGTIIRPFRLIEPKRDLQDPQSKMRQSRAKIVIESIIQEFHLFIGEKSAQDASHPWLNIQLETTTHHVRNEVFSVMLPRLLAKIYRHNPSRPEELTYAAVYEHLTKYHTAQNPGRKRQKKDKPNNP